MNPPFHHPRAFSLPELLIVVAVVLVLGALLLPVTRKVIEQGRLSKSTSNLRQIGIAMQQYLNDRGTWPSAAGGAGLRHWRDDLVRGGYFGDGPEITSDATAFQRHPMLQCPLQAAMYPKVTRKDTFAMNQNLGNQATAQPWHGPRNPLPMRFPSRAALVSGGAFKAPNAFELTFYPSASNAMLPMAVYQGQANILFCDGHVALMKVSDIPTNSSVPDSPGAFFWNGM